MVSEGTEIFPGVLTKAKCHHFISAQLRFPNFTVPFPQTRRCQQPLGVPSCLPSPYQCNQRHRSPQPPQHQEQRPPATRGTEHVSTAHSTCGNIYLVTDLSTAARQICHQSGAEQRPPVQQHCHPEDSPSLLPCIPPWAGWKKISAVRRGPCSCSNQLCGSTKLVLKWHHV